MSCRRKRKKSPSFPNSIEDIGQFEKDPKKYRYFIDRGLKVLLISDKKPDRRFQTINTANISQPLELQSISLDYHQLDHRIYDWTKQNHSSNDEEEEISNFKKNRQRTKTDSKKDEQLKNSYSSHCDLNSLDSTYAEISSYNNNNNNDDQEFKQQNSKKHSRDPANDTNDNEQPMFAGVNLLVATGYLDEPVGYNGLAHLHEHLLTLTLPNHEGEMFFMNTVQEIGGQNTNITERTCTHHSFEVPKEYLESTLSIFTQLLKKRPFPLETIIKETKILDHEFRPNKNVKGMIRDHIISHLAKPGHPLTNFTWGNEQSLGPPIEAAFDKNKVKRYYENLKAQLEKFTETYYVRGNMYLVIQAPMSLDEMQKLAIEAFETIPEGTTPYIPQDPDPFNTDRFQAKKYRIRIPHPREILYLTWALSIVDWQSYKTKPIAYLASIIRSNQPRGLVDYLKRQ